MKWLSNAIYEIKTEIGELQTTLNSSVLLQDHEVHESKMSLLQSDLSSLNVEMEKMKMENAKKDAEMSVLKEELNNLRNDWRTMAETNGVMRNQVSWEKNESNLVMWANDVLSPKKSQKQQTGIVLVTFPRFLYNK